MHGRDLVAQISERHGLCPERVEPVKGGGSVNKAFVVSARSARFVVRFPIDLLRRDEFQTEEWCLTQAAVYGIPSPQVVARGVLHGVPYLVQTFVDGTVEAGQPATASWRTLAAYARIVHTIPLTADAPKGLFTRFGRHLCQAWQAHLDYNQSQLSPLDPLITLGVYPLALQPLIRSRLTRLTRRHWVFGLRHGDLAPRNLLVPPVGAPILIDWGCASAGPIPYGDLLPAATMHLATGRPSKDDLNAFAADLGIPLDQEADIVEDLLLLESLDLVRWAIDQRPDRLPEIAASARHHIQCLQRDELWGPAESAQV